ncbi:MAG: hypothetical protein LBU32_19965 [Clostridiales bacterium]|jgi:hypothetical protein|nr:hypothetical protein [Clostridiales bacterium]
MPERFKISSKSNQRGTAFQYPGAPRPGPDPSGHAGIWRGVAENAPRAAPPAWPISAGIAAASSAFPLISPWREPHAPDILAFAAPPFPDPAFSFPPREMIRLSSRTETIRKIFEHYFLKKWQ